MDYIEVYRVYRRFCEQAYKHKHKHKHSRIAISAGSFALLDAWCSFSTVIRNLTHGQPQPQENVVQRNVRKSWSASLLLAKTRWKHLNAWPLLGFINKQIGLLPWAPESFIISGWAWAAQPPAATAWPQRRIMSCKRTLWAAAPAWPLNHLRWWIFKCSKKQLHNIYCISLSLVETRIKNLLHFLTNP